MAPKTPDYERPDPADAYDAIRRLRALRICHDEGWATYVAGDLRYSRHLVRTPDGTVRLLDRDQLYWSGRRQHRVDAPYWWARGVADANGEFDRLDNVAIPQLVTVKDACRVSATVGGPATAEGLTARIAAGKLYPLYLADKIRWLSVDQIRADADPTAAARWHRFQTQLPPRRHLGDVPPGEADQPPPAPPAIPADLPVTERRTHALLLATEEGWADFVASERDQHHMVLVNGDEETTRVVPGPAVLPWVLGLADGHGHGHLAVY